MFRCFYRCFYMKSDKSMKSLNSCELLTLESLTVSHSCSKPGFGPRAVLLVVGSMPPQWTWLSPQGQHLRAKTSVKNVDTNDKLPGTFRLNENEWNWHIPSFQVHVPPILVSSWWQLHSFALHCPSPPSFLKMVRVQKTKKIEQPAVVTALLQDNHSWSHRVTPITSLKLCHRWSSQSFTIIHNHSQSNIIQHYPTFAENRQMSHSQKAIKKPVDSRSLGLLCRWIQAQRRCARIGCPRNPCEVGRISWILCNKMVV